MRALTLLALLSASAFAAEKPGAPAGGGGDKDRSPKEVAIERMLSERDSPDALAKAIAEAKKQGATDQALLEARFLFLVDRHDDKAIAAMLPEFLKRKDEFKLDDSEIFAVKEDWLAVVEYVQALDLLEKGDHAGFKQHILEAFWLSPRQGAAFAPHIDRLRLKETMDALHFNFDTALAPLDGKEKVRLKSLVEGKKGLLFLFWSPWSRECEDTLPDFLVTTRELQGKGIAVASIMSEDSPDMIAQSRAIVAKLGDHPPGAWLIDDKKDPLNHMFRVQSIPLMVLLSPEGRVLFNGSPSEAELWIELAKLSPGIKRPALEGEAAPAGDKPVPKREH